MKQITTQTDILSKKNVINRIADVPGGVSLVLSTLVGGRALAEATPLSAPSNGKRTVCKQAKVETGSTNTAFPVIEGTHHFKVGDVICTKIGGKAAAITGIVNAGGVDTITVGAAIDALSDGYIYEANAVATGTAVKDATLNIAYANDTCTGLTNNATSTSAKAPAGKQGTVATVVGTIGTSGAGDAKVTISTDLANDIVISVAVANNDTAAIVAAKMGAAINNSEAFQAIGGSVSVFGEQIFVYVPVSTNGAVLKNTPDVILASAIIVPTDTMVIQMAEAYIHADVVEGAIAPVYLQELKTINVVKY